MAFERMHYFQCSTNLVSLYLYRCFSRKEKKREVEYSVSHMDCSFRGGQQPFHVCAYLAIYWPIVTQSEGIRWGRLSFNSKTKKGPQPGNGGVLCTSG